MHNKRQRMPKVKPIPHPVSPPILGVSVFLLDYLFAYLGDNSIKTYHVYRGMIPLHICNRDLNLRLPWNHLHDFKVLMLRKFWVVYIPDFNSFWIIHYTKFQWHQITGSKEGWTWLPSLSCALSILKNFRSPIPRRICMKFDWLAQWFLRCLKMLMDGGQRMDWTMVKKLPLPLVHMYLHIFIINKLVKRIKPHLYFSHRLNTKTVIFILP